jgi:riboflavin kinase / FMN adenylyltransferase
VRATWRDGDDPTWRDAVASLGVRPTFGGGERLLEVHLFGPDVDLYGRRLCCAFIERLRAEETFPTVEALKAQMDRDCAAARAALAAAP